MTQFQLPDRSFTTKQSVYIKEWRALGACVASLLGPDWRCSAFDPNIHLVCSGEQGIDVDVRLARAIARVAP